MYVFPFFTITILLSLKNFLGAFFVVEKVAAHAQECVLTMSDKLVNEHTYEEFENDEFEDESVPWFTDRDEDRVDEEKGEQA